MNAVPVGHAQAVPFNFEKHVLTVSKSHPIALSVGYSAMISNAPPGECGCLLLNGGSSEAMFHVWKNVAAVFQLTADHTGSVPQSHQALSVALTWRVPAIPSSCRDESPFMVNCSPAKYMGFDAYFTRDDAQPNDSANSPAFSTGGGVEIGISEWLSVRTVEAEFLARHMANDLSGRQRSFRISSGLMFRFSSNVLNRYVSVPKRGIWVVRIDGLT